MGKKGEGRDARRKAFELWGQSNEMFAGGDYLMAKRFAVQVTELAPDTKEGREAAARAENLGTVDTSAIYGLLGTLALYLIGWAYALL